MSQPQDLNWVTASAVANMGTNHAAPSLSLSQSSGPRGANSLADRVSKIPHILPHERVFPIQIGSELFKLSGASISSDGEYDSPCYKWQDEANSVMNQPRPTSHNISNARSGRQRRMEKILGHLSGHYILIEIL
jgi:hypothetical protein